MSAVSDDLTRRLREGLADHPTADAKLAFLRRCDAAWRGRARTFSLTGDDSGVGEGIGAAQASDFTLIVTEIGAEIGKLGGAA